MIKKVLIVLITLWSVSGISQENKDKDRINNIQLNYGIGFFMRQDMNVSPMIHNKFGAANLVFKYERENRIDQQVYLKFGFYNPHVDKEYEYNYFSWENEPKGTSTIPHQFFVVDLNYSIGKQLLKSSKFKFTLGARFRNTFNLSFYDMGTGGQTIYYFNSGLDLWLRFKYLINEKHHFEANVGLPLFAYVARSPYMGQDSEYMEGIMSHNDMVILGEYLKRGSMQSWGKMQSFDLDLSYTYNFNKKWSIGASYWFALRRNTESTQLLQFDNTLYFIAKYNF